MRLYPPESSPVEGETFICYHCKDGDCKSCVGVPCQCGCPLKPIKQAMIVCPFCGDGDFDLVGLKSHIQKGECEPCEQLEVLPTFQF